MVEFTLWDILRNLLLAAQWTVALSLIAFVGGGIIGLIVCVGRISANPALAWAARVYIEALQGTPLLMQLFLCFFGLALLGVHLPPLFAAAVALTFYTSAFLGEIWRGCVQAVAERSVGSQRQPRPVLWRADALTSSCPRRCGSPSRRPSASSCR